MHILVVTVVHHPEDARIRHRQIRSLLDAGHRVTYVAPFHDCQVLPPAGVDAVSVPRARGRRRLAAIVGARRAIRDHGPSADLVLLHDPELLVSVRGLRQLPPVVWDIHEDTAAAVSLKPWLPPILRQPASRAAGVAERLAERKHHLILAEDSYASRFRRHHPVVPNTTWVPDAVKPPGDDYVVYIGHISRARGAQEMIDAGRLLGETVQIALIGPSDDEFRPLIKNAHLAGDLRACGFQPNDEALKRLDGALAGLSLLHDEPNYRYSRPTKVIEYMAHGVPVITTPVPAAREIVERHGAGLVVPFADPTAVVDAIKRLRDDADLRTEMGRRGHEAAMSHYAWPVHARAFVAQLEEWSRT